MLIVLMRMDIMRIRTEIVSIGSAIADILSHSLSTSTSRASGRGVGWYNLDVLVRRTSTTDLCKRGPTAVAVRVDGCCRRYDCCSDPQMQLKTCADERRHGGVKMMCSLFYLLRSSTICNQGGSVHEESILC